MNSLTQRDLQAVNQSCLAIALAEIQQLLQNYVARLRGEDTVQQETAPHSVPPAAVSLESPTALDHLCVAFNLTTFECQVLLLCAGVELSATIAQLCATAQGGSQLTYPTFSLALAAFPEAGWQALTPVAPLRHWRLIEVIGSDSLTQSRLRIDERVLHYLVGVSYLDDRLQGLIQPVAAAGPILPSHQQLAQRMINLWTPRAQDPRLPIIHLCGEDAGSNTAIAATACTALDLELYTLRALDIPSAVAEREALARLWQREAMLDPKVLLVNCAALGSNNQGQTVVPFVESLQTWLAIAGPEPLSIHQRPMIHLEVNQSSLAEQRYVWQQALGPFASGLNGHLEGLVSQFNLNASTIATICTEVHNQIETEMPDTLTETIWKTCRVQARPQLDELAQRITPIANWDDLVLPAREQQRLREMTAHVKQRAKVYDTWAFAKRGANGLGISTLFAGPSGTGKTMAAEVLAHELRLDLYRIDLSQVVSKYIGETEKNLSKVFDAAEAGGALLLFDEADALFGKRSEVKDSHDRYANIEVSYLLQRMEAYQGLAILTTNLKNSVDTAFLRRLRFVVKFPFPDLAQRLEIWLRIFPSKLPTEGLDFKKLAQLNITGGNIRNIALNAAFMAADENKPVEMRHLLRAAKGEYDKLEKTLTNAEVGGWI